ncbi:CPBP family intramembrane glutamic endopeptidase [Lacimicrobium sp. SS2-24]|uniref:CPBP family intramembrane glutamic endopeptidase n=1 Tax=Lacimicrobium sp. SS2-24 TaxID=2005569 RepID=UPI001FEF65E1|nr:CPBP family intramembrane glutamic endopeptidase [Lacimicrobium sp. SS2-24]
MLLQPDPWLLSAEHWYFSQPLRLVTELALLASLCLITFRLLPTLLSLPRRCYPHLVVGVLASALLFGVMEWQQFSASLEAPVTRFLMWLLSGFAIGMGQELLYRGWLFTALRSRFSYAYSAGLTTLAFVLAPLHSVRLWEYLQKGELTVVMILVAIYIGASFAFQWLRDISRSALLPAIVHGVGNAITWTAVFTLVR